MRLIFAIFGFNRAQSPASDGIELSREFSWSWDIENVCIKIINRLPFFISYLFNIYNDSISNTKK